MRICRFHVVFHFDVSIKKSGEGWGEGGEGGGVFTALEIIYLPFGK